MQPQEYQQHPSGKHQMGQEELAQLEQTLFQHTLLQQEEHTPVYNKLSYSFTVYQEAKSHNDSIKIGAFSPNH